MRKLLQDSVSMNDHQRVGEGLFASSWTLDSNASFVTAHAV